MKKISNEIMPCVVNVMLVKNLLLKKCTTKVVFAIATEHIQITHRPLFLS